MHLHVVSNTISPAIVLNIRPLELPDHTPCPPAWADQVQFVAAEDLAMPENIHAFDKASWAMTLLNHVEFDLSRHGAVTCTYLDGSSDTWFLPECAIQMLIDVVDAVSESYVIAEREKRAAATASKKNPVMQKLTKSTARRTFKELVSAFIAPSPKEVKSQPEIRPTSSKSGQLLTLDLAQSRHLRRWARSTLVNIFRRFVIPELRVRQSIMAGAAIHTGYVKWIAEAMLAQAHARLNDMLDSAVKDKFGTLTESKSSCRRPSVPWVEDDDDDDDNLSSGTMTSDGASIVTPAEGRSPSRSNLSQEDAMRVPRDLRPTEVLSAVDLSLYEELAHRCRRLGDLLSHIAMKENKYQLDLRHHYAVLEFRAKRKAWSNCTLKGRAGSSAKDLLHGRPLIRSRLATCEPITNWRGSRLAEDDDDEPCAVLDNEFSKSLVATSPMSFASSEDDSDVPCTDKYLLPPPMLPKRTRHPLLDSSLSRGLQELHISKRLANAEQLVEQRRASFHVPRPLSPSPQPSPATSGTLPPTSIPSAKNAITSTIEPLISGLDDEWAYADPSSVYAY